MLEFYCHDIEMKNRKDRDRIRKSDNGTNALLMCADRMYGNKESNEYQRILVVPIELHFPFLLAWCRLFVFFICKNEISSSFLNDFIFDELRETKFNNFH